MARVIGIVTGGDPVAKEAKTIGELKKLMNCQNYAASVNGVPRPDSFELSDNQVVDLATKNKGGK